MSLRLQTALVVLLFLGSLSALVFNVFTAQVSPEREREVRRQLREASRRMVDEASTPAVASGGQGAAGFERLNGWLAEIAEGALADFPGDVLFDVPLLAEHVVARLANKYGWPQLALSPEAMD